jgi:hypothetical protein
MTSTFTNTKTGTRTFARLAIIKLQVSLALKHTTKISPKTIERVFDKGIDEKWIKTICIFAIDKNRCCHAQISIDIDWNTHEYQISIGKNEIEIDINDDNWNNDLVYDLDRYTKLFIAHAEKFGLDTEWGFECSDGVDEDQVHKSLSVTHGKPLKWSSEQSYNHGSKPPAISELSLGLKFWPW